MLFISVEVSILWTHAHVTIVFYFEYVFSLSKCDKLFEWKLWVAFCHLHKSIPTWARHYMETLTDSHKSKSFHLNKFTLNLFQIFHGGYTIDTSPHVGLLLYIQHHTCFSCLNFNIIFLPTKDNEIKHNIGLFCN